MESQTTRRKVFSYLFFALVAYTLLLTMPQSFQATMPYLDAAWPYDLNYFLHSRYHFGPDLIFTYGPLGFLNGPQHVGQDIPIAVAVHILFAFALGAQLTLLWSSGRRTAATMFCISLALSHRLFYDYWDYSLLALSVITMAKVLRSPPDKLDYVLLPILLGTSFLLKFTAFSVMILMCGVYVIHLLQQRLFDRRRMLWLGVCAFSGPAAYLIYDFSMRDLMLYLKGAFQITAGFATAMSIPSDPKYIQLAAIAFLLLICNMAVGLTKRRLLWAESFLVTLVTWSVFRYGFVRGDSSHVPIFFSFSLVAFAFLFMGWHGTPSVRYLNRRGPELLLVLSYAAFSAVAINGFEQRYPVQVASNWWPSQTFNDVKLISHWSQLATRLDHDSDAAFAALPGLAFRNEMAGKRVLVFPNGTPYVAKVSFDMFPLYALQDYAAYTAYLDKKGAANLVEASPQVDKVLLEWEAIDGRNPFLDTPATSLALLSSFMPQSRVPAALLLQHRPAALPIRFTVIDHQPLQPDKWVAVPLRNDLVAMTVNLKQTLMGTLITNLYAQSEVFIELETSSGTITRFRVPPQVLSTPAMINYVPRSLDDWAKFWGHEPLGERVTKVRLLGPGLSWTASKGYFFYRVENSGVTISP